MSPPPPSAAPAPFEKGRPVLPGAGEASLEPSGVSDAARSQGLDPVLRLAGATFAYGRRRVLDGIDLVLRPGEVYALLGSNGAGKSTLIRVVCGQLELAAGTVRVAGVDPRLDGRARTAIGLVPQDIALYPKLTVRENLHVFADLSGVPKRTARLAVERAIERTRAEAVADRPVETLSGGNRRRANIAAALVGEPRLLLLDEPTAGVDAEARRAVHEVVRDLGREGAAVLLATHDFEQAEVLADRVGFLVDGRLALQGPFRSLVDDAFGPGAQEVAVVLGAEPADGGRAALERLGLERADGDLAWSALSRSPDDALRLQEALRGAGVAIREVRTRGAGLSSLFLRHVKGNGAGERR